MSKPERKTQAADNESFSSYLDLDSQFQEIELCWQSILTYGDESNPYIKRRTQNSWAKRRSMPELNTSSNASPKCYSRDQSPDESLSQK